VRVHEEWSRVKPGSGPADNVSVDLYPTGTMAARRPRNVRVARRAGARRRGIVAVVLEGLDRTCTVTGCVSGTLSSRAEAMRRVEAVVPRVTWRETRPGYWVARVR
jgi:hypothetical protein